MKGVHVKSVPRIIDNLYFYLQHIYLYHLSNIIIDSFSALDSVIRVVRKTVQVSIMILCKILKLSFHYDVRPAPHRRQSPSVLMADRSPYVV